MNRYRTSDGVELDLTPEQARQYSKISKLILIDELVNSKKPVRVREVKSEIEIN